MNLKGFNSLRDLFTHSELVLYSSIPHPFNISMLRTALDKRLETDPDYEVFVPLIYYKSEHMKKRDHDQMIFSHPGFFISNKGRIYRALGKKGFFAEDCDSGYRRVKVTVKRTTHYISVHRALACTFIPLGDHLVTSPGLLFINHKDGVTMNIELDNLEWSSPSGNTTHAYRTGLLAAPEGLDNSRVKPVKGNLNGYEFILIGEKDIIANGLNQGNLHSCCRGTRATHKGCSWTFATEEEIKRLPKGWPVVLGEAV